MEVVELGKSTCFATMVGNWEAVKYYSYHSIRTVLVPLGMMVEWNACS